MNIKQAEQATGVSRQNIRFYEREGLLHPGREDGNDYRIYTADDLRALKLIRALRMLDMPLPEIREVLAGSCPLTEAAGRQKARLAARQQELAAALRCCETLEKSGWQAQTLDVDACLAGMEAETGAGGYFARWCDDYRRVADAERSRRFTFTPDSAITTPREFTAALFAYAAENELDLVVTKEGMYPEFTLDGVPYAAARDYHAVGGGGLALPLATVRCTRTDLPAEPADVPTGRRRLLTAFRRALPWLFLLAAVLLVLGPQRLGLLFGSAEGLVVLLGLAAAAGGSWYLFLRFHGGENGRRGG